MLAPARHLTVLACLTLASAAGLASARSRIVEDLHRPVPEQAGFALQDTPVGGSRAPARSGRSSATGSTITVFEGDALVVDPDSGMLVRTDADGLALAELHVGPSAAQVVVDADHARAYVSDRRRDRIAVVSLAGQGLATTTTFSTRIEPYGLALTSDGGTLLVTTVADHTLTAYDTSTGHERWSLELGPEPRAVTLAPDDSEALVTFLTTGVVGRVDLVGRRGMPGIDYVSIDPPVRASASLGGLGLQRQAAIMAPVNRPQQAVAELPAPDPEEGRSFARNAFAAAYVGHGVAVVPHQVSTPHLPTDGDFRRESGGYGGGNGFTPPVAHRLAFLQMPDRGEDAATHTAFATTSVHQPRALAYDPGSDTLYMAGYGSDEVVALAEVSQTSVHLAWRSSLRAGGQDCGPSGLAVDDDDGNVLVFCALTRKMVRLAPPSSGGAPTVVARSEALTASRLSAAAQRGRALFRDGGNPGLSTGGAMACSSCHAEARSDGLSWFLQGNSLQTPFLAGRLVGSHPFKWDGRDGSLQESLTHTVSRLGGTGISARQAKDLQAFLVGVDPPRAPSVEDGKAVARGEKLFHSDVTGCANCHEGPLFTDQKRHPLAPDLGEVDTPSLVGLAHSAPYYHDGSARTLSALLKGNANIHGMGRISRLSDGQIGDLVAYLQTL